MTPLYALTVAMTGLVFTAWSFMMFWTLLAQRRRAVARTGRGFPNVLDALAEWAHWWRSPDLTRPRRILVGLTIAMLACCILIFAQTYPATSTGG